MPDVAEFPAVKNIPEFKTSKVTVLSFEPLPESDEASDYCHF